MEQGEPRVVSWKNRRRMAWLSLIVITIIDVPLVFLGLTSADMAGRIDKLSVMLSVINSIYMTIILGYMGLSTMQDVKMR